MNARAAVAAVAAGLLMSSPSWAVEREHHIGLDGGMSVLVVSDKGSPDVGAGLGAHWTYGLSDAFNVMAEGSWSLVALQEGGARAPKTRPTNVFNLDVGLGYVFDVLRWVPYAEALLGEYGLTGGTVGGTRFLPGVALGAGLDYRIDRSWAVGVALRWHMLVTDMTTYPAFTQTFARAEYTWGW